MRPRIRIHGGGNVVVLALFAFSWWLRQDAPATPGLPAQILSFSGAILSLFTAWLGWELVGRLGVGVSDHVHLDAPSSLRESPDESFAVPRTAAGGHDGR